MRRYEEEAHPFENRHCFVFVQVATVTAPARDRKKTVGVVAAGKPTSPVTVRFYVDAETNASQTLHVTVMVWKHVHRQSQLKRHSDAQTR